MGSLQTKLCHLLYHRHRCCCHIFSSCCQRRPIFKKPSSSAARSHEFATPSPTSSASIPSANLSLLFSSITQPGLYPDDDDKDRQNQDSILIASPLLPSNPDLHLFSVFDGHGLFGTQCSRFASTNLPLALLSDPALLSQDPSLSFSRALLSTNSLLRSSPIDDSMSGTTAVAALVHNRSLVVANVGDSRAVAAVWSPDRNSLVALDLSCDQTPFRRDEYERVRRCGARVLTLEQVEGIKDPAVQFWGDEEEDDDGDPPRLWVQDGMYPGTAFTRSVGDATAELIGVVAEPEVKEVRITPEVRFFVVASDGVFEFMSSQAVVDMVHKP